MRRTLQWATLSYWRTAEWNHIIPVRQPERMAAHTNKLDRTSGEFESPAQHALPPGSDADYRVVANALPDILWTRDAHGRLEWVNHRWYELTGLTEEETLRGTGPTAAIHPDDHEHVERIWQHAIATSSPCDINYRIRNRVGEYRWYLARVAPVLDGNGIVTRWVSSIIDMHERRIAEQALLEWERRFEAVFDVIPHATAIVRLADGAHIQINDAFTRLTGYAPDDIIGQSVVTLGMWRPEERSAFIKPLTDQPGGSAVVPFRAKDGRWIRLALSGRHLDFGGEACMVSVGIDVTEQEANEAALRQSEAQARARADELAALMDAVPAAVWISRDPECLDIRGNRTASEMLRLGSGENMHGPAVNRQFVVCIDGAEVPIEMLPLERAGRGEEVRNHEEEIRFDDGEVRHLFGSAVPLRDSAGTPRGAIGAYVDVTHLKQVEAALREADHRKDAFLALLSHELRNPLAPILTAAQILKRRADPESHIDLDVIIRQAKHLVRLVDDLLDVSRVTRGKVALTRQRVELSVIVAGAVEATGHLFESRAHHLHLLVPAAGLEVDGDTVRLTQVVNNLLSNAAHFTPPGGTITVMGRRDGNDVVLRVRDTGDGIDPVLLPHVFEMFMQGERERSRAEGGLGLGLSLVRALTEQHGGTVTAHSEGLGCGSEFSVRLPAARERVGRTTPASARPTLPPGGVGNGTRVLIVDDNRDVLDTTARLLTMVGYETQTASDAMAALTIASQFRPRIAILDIGMPVMDGYQLARELRACLSDDPPVFVALTGYGQADDRERSRAAGFTRHFAKPVDAAELLDVLEELSARPAHGVQVVSGPAR
jgi:PAS domain S-box-containing protein